MGQANCCIIETPRDELSKRGKDGESDQQFPDGITRKRLIQDFDENLVYLHKVFSSFCSRELFKLGWRKIGENNEEIAVFLKDGRISEVSNEIRVLCVVHILSGKEVVESEFLDDFLSRGVLSFVKKKHVKVSQFSVLLDSDKKYISMAQMKYNETGSLCLDNQCVNLLFGFQNITINNSKIYPFLSTNKEEFHEKCSWNHSIHIDTSGVILIPVQKGVMFIKEMNLSFKKAYNMQRIEKVIECIATNVHRFKERCEDQ